MPLFLSCLRRLDVKLLSQLGFRCRPTSTVSRSSEIGLGRTSPIAQTRTNLSVPAQTRSLPTWYSVSVCVWMCVRFETVASPKRNFAAFLLFSINSLGQFIRTGQLRVIFRSVFPIDIVPPNSLEKSTRSCKKF